MKNSRGYRGVASMAAASLLLTMPYTARADHPAIVFGATAMAVAGVFLGASVIAAAILVDGAMDDDDCDCPGTTTEGAGEGGGDDGGGAGGGGDNGGGAGGGEQGNKKKQSPGRALVFESRGASVSGTASSGATASFDDSTTHPRVTGFIDRKGKLSVQPTKNGYVGASAEYAFDGNVLKAPKGLRKFTHREALIFKLTLDTKALKDPQACAVMSLKDIGLSTEDIPNTNGSVKMSFDVFEKGVRTATRELLVQQGKTSQRPAWAAGPGWAFSKDRIDIINAALSLPCTPNSNGTPTEITVAVNMQFVGAR